MLCENCCEREVFSMRRCGRCYKYRHKMKRERPKELVKQSQLPCSHCGSSRCYAKGLCVKCYRRLRRYGDVKERAYIPKKYTGEEKRITNPTFFKPVRGAEWKSWWA